MAKMFPYKITGRNARVKLCCHLKWHLICIWLEFVYLHHSLIGLICSCLELLWPWNHAPWEELELPSSKNPMMIVKQACNENILKLTATAAEIVIRDQWRKTWPGAFLGMTLAKVVQHVISEANEFLKKQVNQVALLHLTDTDEWPTEIGRFPKTTRQSLDKSTRLQSSSFLLTNLKFLTTGNGFNLRGKQKRIGNCSGYS